MQLEGSRRLRRRPKRQLRAQTSPSKTPFCGTRSGGPGLYRDRLLRAVVCQGGSGVDGNRRLVLSARGVVVVDNDQFAFGGADRQRQSVRPVPVAAARRRRLLADGAAVPGRGRLRYADLRLLVANPVVTGYRLAPGIAASRTIYRRPRRGLRGSLDESTGWVDATGRETA